MCAPIGDDDETAEEEASSPKAKKLQEPDITQKADVEEPPMEDISRETCLDTANEIPQEKVASEEEIVVKDVMHDEQDVLSGAKADLVGDEVDEDATTLPEITNMDLKKKKRSRPNDEQDEEQEETGPKKQKIMQPGDLRQESCSRRAFFKIVLKMAAAAREEGDGLRHQSSTHLLDEAVKELVHKL